MSIRLSRRKTLILSAAGAVSLGTRLAAQQEGLRLAFIPQENPEKLLGDILALSLILGGALGNIKDRYDLGYVVDFADLHFGEFRPFLIFNVADAAITIGVVIVLARAFFMRDKDDEVDGLMNTKAADAAESK